LLVASGGGWSARASRGRARSGAPLSRAARPLWLRAAAPPSATAPHGVHERQKQKGLCALSTSLAVSRARRRASGESMTGGVTRRRRRCRGGVQLRPARARNENGWQDREKWGRTGKVVGSRRFFLCGGGLRKCGVVAQARARLVLMQRYREMGVLRGAFASGGAVLLTSVGVVGGESSPKTTRRRRESRHRLTVLR
jgi:hypothetical protein